MKLSELLRTLDVDFNIDIDDVEGEISIKGSCRKIRDLIDLWDASHWRVVSVFGVPEAEAGNGTCLLVTIKQIVE